jgi:phospholipid/cholesterol/gamma-HCH transport system permease protein
VADATKPVSVGGQLALDEPEPDLLEVRLAGDFRGAARLPSPVQAVERIGRNPALRRLRFEASALSGWDSGLLTCLVAILRAGRDRGLEVDEGALPEGARKLLDLAFAVPERRDADRDRGRESLLARVGKASLEAASGLRDGVAFLGSATLALGRFATGRARYRRSDLWLTIQQCGANALPIVSLISILVGLILAFVGATQLQLFGAEIYVANLVAIGMAREMGAMMAAIIMAGRTGAAFAAQLGTMTVNEEIDALSTLGIQPMDFLVLPRMVALILMMPLLAIYADVLGILGGAIVSIASFGLAPVQYWNQTIETLTLTHLGVGVFKAVIFGVIVALSGCLRGIQCGRSASAVGDAATSAVVTGIVLIIVADSLVTVVTTIVGI